MLGMVPGTATVAFPLEELDYEYIYDMDPAIMQMNINTTARQIVVPVNNVGTMTFQYGASPITYSFSESGTWLITFSPSWNMITNVVLTGGLPSNVIYFSQIYSVPLFDTVGVTSDAPGALATFYVHVTDAAPNVNVFGFWFECNNTGVLENDTTFYTNTSLGWGTQSAWGNNTKTLNFTGIQITVIWKEYFNDTNGNWNNTGTLILIVTTDSIPPTYSSVSTNSTVWATLCAFNATFTDDKNLTSNGWYIFGCNNTGPFTNETLVYFTSMPQSVSIIKTLSSTNSNATTPETIQYEWWFADNAGNPNNTGIHTLTLSFPLSSGWNNVTIFSFDVGYTLAGINASLNYDNINWTYIIYQNSSSTAQYVFVKNMSANPEIVVYQTTGILLIFCGQAGNWTHTYPYQGGGYGSDPTPYIVAAIVLSAAAGIAYGIYRKVKKKKAKAK
jgi:hypothetical protein